MPATLITHIKLLVNTSENDRLLRGKELSELPVLENAYLIIEDGLITGMGTMDELIDPEKQFYSVINAKGQLVLPAWCDSHTHIVFAATREEEFIDKIRGMSYADIVIAGGMESMSNAPFYSENLRWGNKYGNVSLIDGLAKDGLTDVYDGKPMGNAAELCAKECGVSREEQDAFAIESYKRSQAAWEKGLFNQEIVPVEIPQRKGDPVVFAKDEEPFNVKFDKIPSLSPAFIKNGTVTAANASTMNDGAAALLLMSADKANELGLKPIGRIKGYADAEQAPEWFTTTPSIAVPKAVSKAGLTMNDIDYWELNEAFAVVGIENSRRMKLDPAKVNVHGGAASLGHPLGCSGARIIVTLLHVLKANNARYGAAGICNGGGGASAMVIENIS